MENAVFNCNGCRMIREIPNIKVRNELYVADGTNKLYWTVVGNMVKVDVYKRQP